ncbi:hypothetical protein [Moraxella lacunata]|uniref:hypothetical protein n=1 Tax=Moraxella lacunata TaxID=477 RepID=UPI003EE103CF
MPWLVSALPTKLLLRVICVFYYAWMWIWIGYLLRLMMWIYMSSIKILNILPAYKN